MQHPAAKVVVLDAEGEQLYVTGRGLLSGEPTHLRWGGHTFAITGWAGSGQLMNSGGRQGNAMHACRLVPMNQARFSWCAKEPVGESKRRTRKAYWKWGAPGVDATGTLVDMSTKRNPAAGNAASSPERGDAKLEAAIDNTPVAKAVCAKPTAEKLPGTAKNAKLVLAVEFFRGWGKTFSMGKPSATS